MRPDLMSPRAWRHGAALAALGLAIAGLPRAGAQPLPADPEASVITDTAQFWSMSAAERSQPRPYRIDGVITFHDPEWKLLWAQRGDLGFYVPYFPGLAGLRVGDRVRFEGIFPPEQGNLNFEHGTVTVLGHGEVQPFFLRDLERDALAHSSGYVAVEGLVDRQDYTNATHLQLTLSIEGRAVFARVRLDPDKPVPQVAGAWVRISGVCVPKAGKDDSLQNLDLLVGEVGQITVLHWLASDARFNLPRTSIDALRAAPHDQLVRVAGRVKAQEPGRSLTLRDDSGQIVVLTGQMRACAFDETIEAVGYPAINGTRWELASGLFRPLAATKDLAEQSITQVRLGAQVLELSPEAAAKGMPAELSGVVTWSAPGAPYFYIQDASGGVCVLRATKTDRVRPPGDQVLVQGVTAMGAFAPVVQATRFNRSGSTLLPEARLITLEHAFTGVEEAQWVEMRGYVRDVLRDRDASRLDITTPGGRFVAVLPPSDDAVRLIGAVVRLRGVCRAQADQRRKLTGIQLLVPSVDMVQIEEAAPADPFDAPQRSLAGLGQFGTLASLNHRVKVSGTVLRQAEGALNLGDGDEALLVTTRKAPLLAPGDHVDAVGYLGRQGGRVILRDATVRRTGEGPRPAPVPLAGATEVRPELDGRLVEITATLIDRTVVRRQLRLTLQSEDAFFEAYLNNRDGGAALPDWPDGAALTLTAICEVKYGDDGRVDGFQLALRSPADVQVRARPSWFTRPRVLAIAGTLLLGSLAFLGWIVGLRRQVARQTRQIREQLRRETHLEGELQRAARLESLGLLAGGIAHDFNNLLTIVMGNLSLAALDERIGGESTTCLREATKAVMRARDLTQQLLTFAKGGAPVRAAVMLPDVVREVAEFALHGSDVSCEFSIPPGLWPADVDKGQIGQVVQNIVINARQAMPQGGRIEIALRNDVVGAGDGVLAPGRYLRMTISDDGAGIPEEDLARIFEPYFTTKKNGSGLGLATVYSIVKKHHGRVTVESGAGRGTIFTIWLPAAGETAREAESLEQGPPEASGRRRVLFMDDDVEVRRVGEAMLQRLGHAVTGVADGAAAVAEYRRALESGPRYDLVILDLTVPGGMGGRQAMEQLRKLDPSVKAIVSSGYSNDQALANHHEHGFLGRVAKPYELADLARTIAEVLRRERN